VNWICRILSAVRDPGDGGLPVWLTPEVAMRASQGTNQWVLNVQHHFFIFVSSIFLV
jgi:hypothetical protein